MEMIKGKKHSKSNKWKSNNEMENAKQQNIIHTI